MAGKYVRKRNRVPFAEVPGRNPIKPSEWVHWRNCFGWTLKRMADALDIHFKTLSDYEMGIIQNPHPNMVRLAIRMLAQDNGIDIGRYQGSDF